MIFSIGKDMEKYGNKIILFGAAKIGFDLYKSEKFNVIFYFDNDPNKWGRIYDGIECIRPRYYENADVVVANDKHDIDMVAQLLEIGYKRFYVAYPKGDSGAGRKFGLKFFDYSKYQDFNIDEKKIALLSNSSSGCNSYCFKYMLDNSSSCNYNLKLLHSRNKENDYYYDIFTSKYIFLTMSFTSLKNRIIIQSYHSFTIKGIGYFDNNIAETSFELTHNDVLKSNYILSYGKLYSMCFGASFGIPKSRFLDIGVPRNDVLLNSNGILKIHETFPYTINKKIILYTPTYRERTKYTDSESQGYIFDYPDFSIDDLDLFLHKMNAVLLVKMHLEDSYRFHDRLKDSSSIFFIKEEDYEGHDFYEYINAVDVLITDYSSIFVDFLLLDRPILFAHRDIDKYEEERGIMWEPIEFWFPGIRVFDYEELKNSIKEIINGKDIYNEKRHVIRDLMHKNKDGKASERLLELLENNESKTYYN